MAKPCRDPANKKTSYIVQIAPQAKVHRYISDKSVQSSSLPRISTAVTLHDSRFIEDCLSIKAGSQWQFKAALGLMESTENGLVKPPAAFQSEVQDLFTT
jgi:hypothetical protein